MVLLWINFNERNKKIKNEKKKIHYGIYQFYFYYNSLYAI